VADYVTLHAPYIKDVTHHMIDADMIALMKPDASILNFARGELVDTAALRKHLDGSGTGNYISDFPVDELWDHPNCVVIPHLGASTAEAEENAAAMAAETLRLFLEHGIIRNSVNFPAVKVRRLLTKKRRFLLRRASAHPSPPPSSPCAPPPRPASWW